MAGFISTLAFLAAAMSSAPASASAPIRLVVEPAGDAVRLKVIGESDVAVKAGYSLEVSGGAGRNRSLQRGQATLRPGVAATLVTLTLGDADGGWSATLTVSPEGGEPYERTADSENY